MLKGKYVPDIKKEYDCTEMFESPLFDKPLSISSFNVTGYVTQSNILMKVSGTIMGRIIGKLT